MRDRLADSQPERWLTTRQMSERWQVRKPRLTLVSPVLALPALASTTGQLLLGLVAVVVLILGLVALVRCDKKDIPAVVRALMRMGPRDDDSRKGPPSLPRESRRTTCRDKRMGSRRHAAR